MQTAAVPIANASSSSSSAPAAPTTTSHENPTADDLSAYRDLVLSLLVCFSLLVGLVLVANVYTLGNCLQALLTPQRSHLQRAVAAHDVVKSEGYLQVAFEPINRLVDF